MFYKLNLPKPSNDLILLVKKLCESVPINESTLRWHEEQQPPNTNCAIGDFFTDDALIEGIHAEFPELASSNFLPGIGLIRSNGTYPASYAPHCDQRRIAALNYYIESGGDNVRTVFYDKVNPENDPGGHVLSYNDLPPIITAAVLQNDWYVLPSNQYHSVENIRSERILLTVSFNSSIDSFLNQYPHLLYRE